MLIFSPRVINLKADKYRYQFVLLHFIVAVVNESGLLTNIKHPKEKQEKTRHFYLGQFLENLSRPKLILNVSFVGTI